MSEDRSKGTISLEEIAARINELREYANMLASTINTYVSQQRELQLALETLKNMPDEGGSGYVVIDRLSTAMIPATISEGWSKSILVHLGLGYYLKTDKTSASEIISKKSSSLEKLIAELQRRYRVVVEELEKLQSILTQLTAGGSRLEETSGG
ncbi:MAG: prefoldin domain-containing protein [Desulfurococcus sp.]|nr:prefoldin domain-containing protein [Desulfurococcus sp.]